jgi:Transposase
VRVEPFGHDYITLFVDIDTRRVLFVADGGDADIAAQFADDPEAHNGDASHIKEACIDMRPRSPSTSSTRSSSATTPSTRSGAPKPDAIRGEEEPLSLAQERARSLRRAGGTARLTRHTNLKTASPTERVVLQERA